MTTDPIADLLTRLRNAIKARHRTLEIKSSKMKKSIIQVLHEKGYIQNYAFQDKQGPQGTIKVGLKYNPTTKENAITKLQRISKPSVRKYNKAIELPHVLNGLGIAIVSTSQGVMSDKEARKKNIGGEVLCYIY